MIPKYGPRTCGPETAALGIAGVGLLLSVP